MNVRPTMLMPLLVAVTVDLAPGASAQKGPDLPSTDGILTAAVAELGSEPGPSQFGSNWFTKMIPPTTFFPGDDLTTYIASGNGYYHSRGSNASYRAPLDLPPGTEVQQVCLFVLDSSSTFQIGFNWVAFRMGDSTEASGSTSIGSVYSGVAETPGETVICVVPASPVQIRAIADVDGDGDQEYNYHALHLSAGGDTNVRWGAAYVVWRRAMSPAPATATFPNDVPTSHPFFQYIEALSSSGITAGCGTGLYCPDQPLTRGQMAVFLAGALGLYWPY
jgi:hypothetical protein